MLTRLTIRNFKQFQEVEIELGQVSLLVGPNNSGKTSALQALALWEHGLRLWWEKRRDSSGPGSRPGVTLNRRDLVSLPIPSADLLWRQRDLRRSALREGKKVTQNVRVDIVVEGVTDGVEWVCGLEFDYANVESIYCRPARREPRDESRTPDRMDIPEEALGVRVAYLPPMSGLAVEEPLLMEGAIKVLVGQGRTAEVLRNLCWMVFSQRPERWKHVQEAMKKLFGTALQDPVLVSARGAVELGFIDPMKTALDLSASGRGFQQTLLLLTYLALNPGSVVLLDEPDAHLEVLRQRQLYRELTEHARRSDSQVIAASHSEVLLNEAADRDVVVAFVGKPHRIDDRGTQVLKALKEIGFEMYLQAEQTGWVLYLEGSTDLEILRRFAIMLEHPAQALLERPFVHYVGNSVRQTQSHFYGLQEASSSLVGFALFDRLEKGLPSDAHLSDAHLKCRMWKRREIENYLCQPSTLSRWAADQGPAPSAPLFDHAKRAARVLAMDESIRERVAPAFLRDRGDVWWWNVKASDELLDGVFEDYYRRVRLPNLMRKSDYHQLAPYVLPEELDPEIAEVLDALVELEAAARPARI